MGPEALATGSLMSELRERLSAGGPITFAEYMQQALYHPTFGYYINQVPGDGAHYATSPTVSPWFGRLVARELQRMWEALGRPEPFTVVEMGAGQADLAAGAIEAAGPMSDALRWRFVERFPAIEQLQRRRLGRAAERAEWASEIGDFPPATGCIVANEVFDNFPVHLLSGLGGGEVGEVYVGLEGQDLVESIGPLSDSALEAPAREASRYLQEGDRFEVCPGLDRWCRQASGALDRGYLLIIDYGDEEPDILRTGSKGTIATFGPMGSGRPALERPGQQDITADVNFSALARAALRAGFEPGPVVNQGPWLLSLGLLDIAHHLYRAAAEAVESGRHKKAVSLFEDRSLVLKLAAEGGLGEALVLLAAKAAPLDWIAETAQP
jgi:SAM-dependent MidA family methyltransferase